MPITVGDLEYLLSANLDQFEADLAAAERIAKTSGQRMAGSLAPYDAAISKAARRSDALGTSQGPVKLQQDLRNVESRANLVTSAIDRADR